MKKYLASGGLILASLAYAFFQHAGEDDSARVVVAPPSGTTTDTPISTSTTSAPFGSSAPTATAPNPTPVARSGSATPPEAPPVGQYKDGSYTGTAADAYYGYVQVRAVVSGGALTDVQILQYPNDRSTSRYINSQALPYLKQEALSAQSATVDTVSGASDTSGAFRQSLSSALSQAKA